MNKENLYNGFYNAIKESYINYLIHGDRSDKKLKPLHKWVGNVIKEKIPDNYKVYYLNGLEVKTEGKYYPKIVDVAIVRDDVDVEEQRVGPKTVYYIPEIEMAISIKFITSNFSQNANNYFENLLGECANLRAKGIKFGHFVVFRDKIPYFKSGGKLSRWESLNNEHMSKYIKLNEEKDDYLHVPNVIGLEIININPIIEEIFNKKPTFSEDVINSYNIKISNGINNTRLSKDVIEYIRNNFNIQKFFEYINNHIR